MMETETALELTPAARAVWEQWWMKNGREVALYDPDDLAAKIVQRLKTMYADDEIGLSLTVEDIEDAFDSLKTLGLIKPAYAEVRAARGAEAAREREFGEFYAKASSTEIRRRIGSDPEFRSWAENRIGAEVKHPDDASAPAPEMFYIRRASDGRYFAEEDGQGRPSWRTKKEHASLMGKTRSQVTAAALSAQGEKVEVVQGA